MKLYEVTNGYIGNSAVRVLVITENKERAIELARIKFKKEAEQYPDFYDEDYYEDLEAYCLCDNANKEWASEAQDE